MALGLGSAAMAASTAAVNAICSGVFALSAVALRTGCVAHRSGVALACVNPSGARCGPVTVRDGSVSGTDTAEELPPGRSAARGERMAYQTGSVARQGQREQEACETHLSHAHTYASFIGVSGAQYCSTSFAFLLCERFAFAFLGPDVFVRSLNHHVRLTLHRLPLRRRLQIAPTPSN